MKDSHPDRVFLTAEWRDLVMLNYEVDSALLTRHVPPGTTLDSFAGKTYVSLVGFRFLRTRLLRVLPLPFHTDFSEVNLRFYVRRKEASEERRGVVFIAEIVPHRAIATVARLMYGENYRYAHMRHRIENGAGVKSVEFRWRVGNQWCRLSASASGVPTLPAENSLEQFITEHYWGYSAQNGGGSMEYRVFHPQWQVSKTEAGAFEGDASPFYGRELAAILQRTPSSAFVAEGSPVTVFRGRRIP